MNRPNNKTAFAATARGIAAAAATPPGSRNFDRWKTKACSLSFRDLPTAPTSPWGKRTALTSYATDIGVHYHTLATCKVTLMDERYAEYSRTTAKHYRMFTQGRVHFTVDDPLAPDNPANVACFATAVDEQYDILANTRKRPVTRYAALRYAQGVAASYTQFAGVFALPAHHGVPVFAALARMEAYLGTPAGVVLYARLALEGHRHG